jgi:integrase
MLPKPAKVHLAEHRAALPWAEVPALMAVLAAETSMAARCLRFLALTGVRSAEARGATWDEIDLDAKVWVIPAKRMKGGRREHRVPLSDAVLAVLAEAAEARTNALVFAGNKDGLIAAGTMVSLLRRVCPGDATVHGLRSAFADWAADHGHPPDLAEMALAHTVGSAVERAYRRSDVLDRRRVLMAEWAEFLTKPPAEVIPLRGVAAA